MHYYDASEQIYREIMAEPKKVFVTGLVVSEHQLYPLLRERCARCLAPLLSCRCEKAMICDPTD